MRIASRCLAAVISALLVVPPAFAFGHKKKKQVASSTSPLTQDERVLQALNRLSFGPRPGDVAAVKAMGVERWIDLQLHPERIDDSALEARLAAYPAMQLSLRDLVARFPSPAMIRQAERGRVGIPDDPVERAIYNDQIAQMRERQAKRAENAAANAAPGNMSPGQTETTAPEGAPRNSVVASGQADQGMAAGTSNAEPSAEARPGSNPEEKLYADLAATSVVNLPPEQRVEKLVAMQPEEFRNFLQHLNRPDRVALFAGLEPEQRETIFALINPQLVVGGELVVTRLLRDVASERQLQAVMTDFWLNHFNVYLRKGEFAPWYLTQYQDEAIRPHALGKFEDLLVATAQSPAMLFYLDQSESVGPHSLAAMRMAAATVGPNGKARPLGLNENYARELMELHTLGVDGGYTQRDVTEMAKVFTGWSIEHPEQGAQFVFNARRHEPGQKVVLGWTIPESGEREGLEVLHQLSISPATAHHVSFQLAQRFVSDDPPSTLVDAMAATWVKTGGDIREVLQTMLDSPEFWSRGAYRAKVKTPEEYVISAVRATGGEVVHPAALVESIAQLGMPLYGCQTPNGYAWTADPWLNSGELLDRMNFSLALADNNAGTRMRWDELTGGSGEDGQAKESRLEDLLLDGPASAQTRSAALAQLAQQETAAAARPQLPKPVNFVRGREFGQLLQAAAPLPPPGDQQAALLAGLLLGSPEFQRR
jgi:hypothetical protein